MLIQDNYCTEVARANEVLKEFYERFSHKAYPLFGGGLFDRARGDSSLVAAATVSHRFLKKFVEPTDSLQRDLTKRCYESWLEYEEELRHYSFYSHPAPARGVVYRARALIHKWFASFQVSLTDVDLEFTPGETFNGQDGYVSVFQKLRRKDAWTVTHDAADDFIRLCYNNLSLKRCAKKHMAHLSQKEYRALCARHNGASHLGFAVFRERMLNEVVTIVHGSRASSVEKNANERRFINVEPLGNMLLQRVVAQQFRQILKEVGNDLQFGQELHRLLISDPTTCTVDFRKASDSTLCAVIDLLFPGRVAKYLYRYRSPMVLVDGVYHLPAKLSSMGNGFTFEVMSTILLAVARVLDGAASVYGDDVILRSEFAPQFISAAAAVGYRVNAEKTFINSPIRESCGAFYCDGYGYISCFDISWCQSIHDVITTVNKFYIMAQTESACKQLLTDAYEALILCVPPCFMGPPRLSLHSDYAFCVAYRKKHMRSAQLRQLFADNVEIMSTYLRSTLGYVSRDLALVQVPRLELKDASKKTRCVPDSGFKYSSYLFAGRVCDDKIRHTGHLVFNLHVVTPSGLLLSYRKLRDECYASYALAVLVMLLRMGFRFTRSPGKREDQYYAAGPDLTGPLLRV